MTDPPLTAPRGSQLIVIVATVAVVARCADQDANNIDIGQARISSLGVWPDSDSHWADVPGWADQPDWSRQQKRQTQADLQAGEQQPTPFQQTPSVPGIQRVTGRPTTQHNVYSSNKPDNQQLGYTAVRGQQQSSAPDGASGFEAFGEGFDDDQKENYGPRSNFRAAAAQSAGFDDHQRIGSQQQPGLGGQHRFGGPQGGIGGQQGGFGGQHGGFGGPPGGFGGQQGGGPPGRFGGQRSGFGSQQVDFSGLPGGFSGQQAAFDSQAGQLGGGSSSNGRLPGGDDAQTALHQGRFHQFPSTSSGFPHPQNQSPSAGYQQQLTAYQHQQQQQQGPFQQEPLRGGRGFLPHQHPNAIPPFGKPAPFDQDLDIGQSPKNKREFANQQSGFTNNLNFPARAESSIGQDDPRFFEGPKLAPHPGSGGTAFPQFSGGPGQLPFLGQSYQQINFPLRAGPGGGGADRFGGFSREPHQGQLADPSNVLPQPFASHQFPGPKQDGRRPPFSAGQGQFGHGQQVAGLAAGGGPSLPDSSLIEGNPFSANDQLDLEKMGGNGPAEGHPGRPFLPFPNGIKPNRGKGDSGSGVSGSGNPAAGQADYFDNFGPELLQDFGGSPDFEADEQESEGDNDYPRPGGGQSSFFADELQDFSADDSALGGGGGGGNTGDHSTGLGGSSKQQKKFPNTSVEHNSKGERVSFSVQAGSGYRGSRGAGVGRTTSGPVRLDTNKARARGGQNKGPERKPAMEFMSGTTQNSASEANTDFDQINSFGGFSSLGTGNNNNNNNNNNEHFDRDYDFGMSDDKEFANEFQIRDDSSNFFDKQGMLGPVTNTPGRARASPTVPTKAPNAKPTSMLKFPRQRRNFTPDGGKAKISNKNDEGELGMTIADRNEDNRGDIYEIFTEPSMGRKTDVEKFVLSRSQQQLANFTMDTTNNWVPIINKNI